MADTNDFTGQLGEIERKISEGEALLRRAGTERVWLWILFSGGLLAVLFSQNLLIVIAGVAVLVVCVWRMTTTEKYAREIEDGLREYKGRRGELLARLVTRE